MEFKDKLKRLRKERSVSQQALADAIFVSRSAVAKWENGLGLPSSASSEALAKHFGDEIVVVDVGVMTDYNCPAVINRKIAYGTKNLYLEPAMTREEAEKAICVGLEMADKCAEDGVDAIGVGEMGIGNTTTSSAILSAIFSAIFARSSAAAAFV